jgi:hypothetical protein
MAQKPTPTPLARVIDEHWRELIEVGATSIWRADGADRVALYRQQMRARARRQGIRIRTYAREHNGQFIGCAFVPEASEAQMEAARDRWHHHGLALPER